MVGAARPDVKRRADSQAEWRASAVGRGDQPVSDMPRPPFTAAIRTRDRGTEYQVSMKSLGDVCRGVPEASVVSYSLSDT
jgi:hypothetical protein